MKPTEGSRHVTYWTCLDPTQISLIPILHHPSSFHSTSPSRPSDVCFSTGAGHCFMMIFMGISGPSLAHAQILRELPTALQNCCEKSRFPILHMASCVLSQNGDPMTGNRTSCETISAAAQPPCCVTVSCTA